MNDTNLKQLWSDASKIIETKNKLSEEDIQNTLAHKSHSVISKFRREKKLGLLMVWFLPLLGIIEIINSNLSAFSFAFTGLLLGISILSQILVNKQLKNLDSFKDVGSIKEVLQLKIGVLQEYFRFGRKIAPIIGLVLMNTSILVINLIDNGSIPTHLAFWAFLISISIGYWFLIRYINKKQEEKYIIPLKQCLNMMHENKIDKEVTPPTRNITLIVFIILIIVLVINVVFFVTN